MKPLILKIVFVICYLFLNPAILDNFYLNIPNEIWFVFFLFTTIIISWNKAHSLHFDTRVLIFYLFPLYSMIISTLRLDVGGFKSAIEVIVVTFCLLQFIVFLGWKTVSELVFSILFWIGLFACVTVFLVFFGLKPLGTLQEFEGFKQTWNFGFAVSNTFYITPSFSFIRTGGVFDEPGRLSLLIVLSLLLLANMRNLIESPNKLSTYFLIQNYVTTSLVGFVAGSLIILQKQFSALKLKNIFFALFFLTFAAVVLSQNEFLNDIFKLFILDRIQYDSNIGFAGNNRFASFAEGWEILKVGTNSIIGTGEDILETQYPGYDRSSIFGILVMYGIVGSFLYFLPVFFILAKMIENRQLLHAIILVMLIIQRPYIYSFHVLVLIFLIILSYKHMKKSNG